MYTVIRTPAFDAWMRSQSDSLTRVRLARRIARLQLGLFGDIAHVGEGVFELREFFGPGWRMYYTMRGGYLVVLLTGGDKSTQRNDIGRAVALAKALEV